MKGSEKCGKDEYISVIVLTVQTIHRDYRITVFILKSIIAENGVLLIIGRSVFLHVKQAEMNFIKPIFFFQKRFEIYLILAVLDIVVRFQTLVRKVCGVLLRHGILVSYIFLALSQIDAAQIYFGQTIASEKQFVQLIAALAEIYLF